MNRSYLAVSVFNVNSQEKFVKKKKKEKIGRKEKRSFSKLGENWRCLLKLKIFSNTANSYEKHNNAIGK